MNTPLFSVIIPAYNAEHYLADAITSILQQRAGSYEIILVDDGSTDNTAKVAKGFAKEVHYHAQPNTGSGAARNTGVQVAKGRFLSFLDADDLWSQDKLTHQLSQFDQKPDLDMVFGHVEQFISPELTEMLHLQTPALTKAMPGHHVGTMMIKRESFFRVGMFREDLSIGETVDWFGRAQDLDLNTFVMPQVVMKRRIHLTNQMRGKQAQYHKYAAVLKATLDRRRQQGLNLKSQLPHKP
jgi:glycosyltransferase involved in cell wall biosynthesis